MIRFKQVVSGVLTGFLFCGSAISGAPLIAAAKTETTYSLTLDKTENGSVAIFDAEKEAKKDESKEQQNTEATTKEKALTKKVKAGDTVSIKVKPDAKYIIKKLSLIDPETKKKLDVELFADEKHEDVVTFTMPAQDVLVTSSYEEGTMEKGQTIAVICTENGEEVKVEATLTGLVRGLIRDAYPVTTGFKIADIDPRESEYKNCFTISDKARNIGGSVLEGLMMLENEQGY